VIVSDLAPDVPADSINTASPLAVAGRMIDFLFEQQPDSLGPGDIRIVSHVVGVGNLDFTPRHIGMAVDSGIAAARRAFAAPGVATSASRRRNSRSGRLRRVGVARQPSTLETPLPTRMTASRWTGYRIGRPAPGARARPRHGQRAQSDGSGPATERGRGGRTGTIALWLTPRGSGDSVHFDAQAQHAPSVGAAWAGVRDDVGGAVDRRRWIPISQERYRRGAAFVDELRRGVVAGD